MTLAPVPMLERDLQQAVIDTARTFGWRVAHFRPAQTLHGWRTPVQADGKGFPDLVLVHPQRGIVFAELKSGSGRLTEDQRAWHRALHDARAEAYVWTPEDWPDRIVQILRGAAWRHEP